MARSYRYPIFKDRNPGQKTNANKKVRRKIKSLFELPFKGKWYKKIFNQYDICDWKFTPFTSDQLKKAKRK